MESTIEKLNQNRLLELTEQDYENIVNNTELKTLFLLKVKEGHPFDMEEAYVLEEELFSGEYIIIVLDMLKEQHPDEFVNFFFSDTSKIREQFDEHTANLILQYIQDNMHYALSKLQNLDQTYEKIENPEIIQEIITNKIEKHYGSIYMDPVTKEFEELLLKALETNEYKYINSITPSILKKAIETGNAKAAMYGVHPTNQEESEMVFAALEQEIVHYNDLLHNFREHHKSDLRLIKHQLRNETYIHFDEEDLKREEVRNLIIEEIEKNPALANEWGINYSCEKYPDIAITLIKYWKKDTIENLISYKSDIITPLLQEYKEQFIDALIYNLEHNQSAIEDIIENFYKQTSWYPEIGNQIIEDPKFFQYYVSKISIDKILTHLISYEYHGNPEYYITPEKYELLSKAKITFSEVPKNINYKVDYPENIWLALIPILEADQLVPNNISLDRFIQYERIFDCILLRLKELKSNSYNSYLEYWQGPITQTLIDIVCDPSNPLNLNTTQKIRILPASKMKNTKHLLDIIKQVETINANDLQIILPTILEIENTEEIKDICTVLFPKIEKNQQSFLRLGGIAGDVYGTIKNNEDGKPNISEQHLTFYNCLKEYLKTQQNIPLTLTKHFDEEVATLATYSNLDALVSNPDLFLVGGLAPHHFVKFIKECQDKNLPMDLKLVHKAAESSVSKNPYKYENITFGDDKETYDILYKLLNCAPAGSIERKVVELWINNNLTYKFFDCQIEGNKTQFLDLLIMDTHYTDKILEVISAGNIKDNVVLSSALNRMLVLEQETKERTEKVLNTIIQLIEQGKMDNFKPQHNLESYVELIDHPTFVNYVIKTYVSTISSHTHDLRVFLTNEKYKQATLDVLHQNTHLATNAYVQQLINEIPEIKKYVKVALEQNDNAWLDFNANYLDVDLLNAYLKHRSIDKVITFIVHDQNTQRITPELYAIIKPALLNAHPEYNKETFDILEQFYDKKILLLLETENFKKLLQKDPEVAIKFTEVFKERKLDEGIITSINDSFRQNYFNIENTHIINFYTNTLEKIQRGITEEEIQEVIDVLINYIPSNLEKDLEATGNELLLNTYKVNKHDFLKMLIQELINNQNIYAPIFNKITNNLIVQKRNEYRSTQDIYKDTNLKYELDTKSLHNALFNYLSKNDPNELLDLIEFTEYDTDINWKTIQFLSGKTDKLTQEEIPSIKRNIPKLKAAIIDRIFILNEKDNQPKKRSYWSWYDQEEEPKKFPNLPRRYEYLLDIPEFSKLVKKIPIYPTRKNPTEMFGNINIDVFETLTKDEEKFNALVALLNKYRFLEWEDLFSPTVSKLSLGEDAINIYNFINAFSKIYDNEKKIILRERKKLIDAVVEEMRKSGKSEEEITDYIRVKEAEPININITAYKVLKYSTIYSSISNYYKIILGMEDFDLVKRNDGPNSSYHSAEERLQRASEMQIKMMELNEITIPSFIHDHEIDKEKKTKLRVTVGNRADSRNLTHGERTGACMRAYGHADSLFEFCNTDPRGFHIVFTDPITNEYVSRVSGFRNGNTVFLNQLRNSTCSKYTNQDVIDACKSVAQELIERSKDSDMPIENVVASPMYALLGHETQQLSEYNIGAGVYNGYKDVNYNAVVLATTGEYGKAVPVKLDGENQPIYEPVRLLPKEYSGEQVTESVKISLQRISSIKECLENKDNPYHYKTIDFDYEIIDSQFIHVIIGQDWYVALDINGNIIHDIAVQNEHSIEELNEALAKVSQIKEDKMKIGGFTNGIQ